MKSEQVQALVRELQDVLARHGLRGHVEVGEFRIRDGFWDRWRPDFEGDDDWESFVEDVEVDYRAWTRQRARDLELRMDGVPGRVDDEAFAERFSDLRESWLQMRGLQVRGCSFGRGSG